MSFDELKSGQKEDSRPLSVFDLDGTLTTRDTFLPFLISYGFKNRRWAALMRLPIPTSLYVFKLLKDYVAKESLLVSFFAGEEEEKIERHAKWFTENWVQKNLNQVVINRLQQSIDAGDRVIVLSASPGIYVRTIASSLGVDEVVCTEVAFANGQCLGKIDGLNCKGPNKVKLLKEYLQTDRLENLASAYGDSHHDFEILSYADQGWLVKGENLSLHKPEIND